MAFKFKLNTGIPSQTIKATVQRRSDGQWWDDTASQFQASEPAYADKTIDLTEGTGEYVGYYSGSASSSLGTDTVDIFYHDSGNSEAILGTQTVELVSGDEVSQAAIKTAVDSLSPVTTQPRQNRPAGRAFRLKLSSRTDGKHKATRPIRLRPGAVGDVAVGVDMSPVFGSLLVKTVGTPVVSSGGSITASALGPHDTEAMIQMAGTAAADEVRTVTFPVTMETDETVDVVCDLEVFAD